jgi:antitoxin CcdA
MQDRAKPRKRAVNLSIDAALLEEAKAAGTNLSALLEGALREKLRNERWQSWRKNNRASIDSMNRHVAKHGLLSDKYRVR